MLLITYDGDDYFRCKQLLIVFFTIESFSTIGKKESDNCSPHGTIVSGFNFFVDATLYN